MHFVSIGTLISMLLFWVGTYLVTIWLMSLLFPAVSKGKRDKQSELPVENVSAVDRQVSATPQEPFCITEIHLSEIKRYECAIMTTSDARQPNEWLAKVSTFNQKRSEQAGEHVKRGSYM